VTLHTLGYTCPETLYEQKRQEIAWDSNSVTLDEVCEHGKRFFGRIRTVLPCGGAIRTYSVSLSNSSNFSFVESPNPKNDSLRRGAEVKSTLKSGG